MIFKISIIIKGKAIRDVNEKASDLEKRKYDVKQDAGLSHNLEKTINGKSSKNSFEVNFW